MAPGFDPIFMFWFVIGSALLVFGVCLMAVAHYLQPVTGPRCGGCGYNLTGSATNRCPECGSLFIEAGVITEKKPRPLGRAWVGVLLVALLLLPIGFGATVLLTRSIRRAAMRDISPEQRARIERIAKLRERWSSTSASQPASRPSSPD